ncbi:hypothetical protein F9B85_00840 [Heliorestis acidaminivorans]|uniref:Uncharacterized protein n=1 Tax=Heliorestis acidaminivorans TaxID=553427 RepID=A0A6I0F427_9FIRM|nr:hypothetical protein [Heliorestis acidaminivorans]KAB2954273.1 hypothetical protein F9B85_00840 [Heliorestis acidaminivorans]
MKESLRSLFYIANRQVDAYLYENHSLRKISTYENFTPQSIDKLWDWWIGSMSYIYELQCMDICVAGDCEKFTFAEGKIDFGMQTNWTLQNIQNSISNCYPHIQHRLIYGEENNEDEEALDKHNPYSFFSIKSIRIFMPYDYFSQVSISKTEKLKEALPYHSAIEDNSNLEEGILYRYFNKKA